MASTATNRPTSSPLLSFLERLADEPARATGYELIVYPLCNPVGYARDTRHNGADLDLNRQFWRGSV